MGKSELLTEELIYQLKTLFHQLNQEVRLVAVLEKGESKSEELTKFLDDIVETSTMLNLQKYSKEEAFVYAEKLDLNHLPSINLFRKDGSYTGISFHGIPGGKELNSFAAAILNCGGAGKTPDKFLKRSVDSIDKKTDIKIFVSLACHHCPYVVAACHRIAYMNSNVQAHMYDANLYSDLVDEFKIERVPMMVINDTHVYYGKKTIEEIANLLNMTKK